ncbi:12S rRNA N4-methylcytidine (m4C) methyltransferase [Sceloporus undulatus]|uniref:12S rRNA N4-methylcytidine (m4C) methyltransferase n=1 Tax=Sceloporus undulatus TaxID=8520 RepID=UPI001C4A82B1|nr:12S rRNA N4-methylcytidine (m4C) methyltransferase [Sceloporus undulatus]XP_042330492.1 12S rRNA N4-methylcytidine (m4C) methyltransferase [Sceloporus undulatus]XP_042330578.1 12S rRNA N4-methylcytidine (m4C) methyltransferase [Sceloporus undulatus]XP_042330665.1 12S rRNA N4-methylcytidine (m4C) methyltransferase [Sceloporus undulatus]
MTRFLPYPSINILYNMLQLPYLYKIWNQFLFHSLIKSSPICLDIWVKNIHSSLVSKCETEKQSLPLHDNENFLYRVDNEDNQQLHIPVMVKEVVNFLAPQNGQCILDMTFGAGGHTKALMQKATDIKIYALDRDPTAYELARQLSDSFPQQIQPLLGQFSELETLLTSVGVQPGSLDGVLLDAGCSSMQLDTPERGFSLRKDGPLDMRMDGGRYPDMPTAADVVNALDQQALASILRMYGEEKHAKKIALAIVQARSVYPITRTQQLASIVAGALPDAALYARKDLLQRPTHVATKTFQALRIFVNNELHELYAGLKTADKFLKPGGRFVALSFHSLEDRIIKRFLLGIDVTEKFNLSVRQKIKQIEKNFSDQEEEEEEEFSNGNSKWEAIQKKVLIPHAKDLQDNPRARSAKLRGAIKL